MDKPRPETTEPLSRLNRRLLDMFGRTENRPTWRVIASWEDIDKEMTWATPSGIILSTPIVTERKRYSFLPDCYMLQKYTPTPIPGKMVKFSYETVYPFLDKEDNPLPLEWEKIYFYVSIAVRGPQLTADDVLKRQGYIDRKEVENYEQQFGEQSADHSYGRGISLAGLDARPSAQEKK